VISEPHRIKAAHGKNYLTAESQKVIVHSELSSFGDISNLPQASFLG